MGGPDMEKGQTGKMEKKGMRKRLAKRPMIIETEQ